MKEVDKQHSPHLAESILQRQHRQCNAVRLVAGAGIIRAAAEGAAQRAKSHPQLQLCNA